MSESLRWILPSEVMMHNTSEDCWVSFLDRVWDLTKLCQEHKGEQSILPIIKAAGTDISHWFNPETRDIRTKIDPKTELRVAHLPVENLLHVSQLTPNTTETPVEKPWWKDESQIVGKLSHHPRYIRILNTLTKTEDLVEVANEETLNDIMDRYKRINTHADSYTWKFLGNVLKMEKTLDQNGILDETDKFARYGMDFDEYIPAIMIYFNDDLTAS